MGDPTSSYATASIALRVLGALKPHHHDKVETPSVGKNDNICPIMNVLQCLEWDCNCANTQNVTFKGTYYTTTEYQLLAYTIYHIYWSPMAHTILHLHIGSCLQRYYLD
jgi:hypothetical protein